MHSSVIVINLFDCTYLFIVLSIAVDVFILYCAISRMTTRMNKYHYYYTHV